MAAQEGHLNVCRILMKSYFNKNPQSNSGRTPLHIAAERGHSEVCDVLLKNSDTDRNVKDDYGQNALHSAASKGHSQASIHILDLLNQTPWNCKKL